jgi:hypothetical protein
MNSKIRLSLVVAAGIALAGATFAAGGKTYQVTGTVVEVTATKIVVQKGTERWELDVGPETKGSGGNFKAGDKVTISYTMNATSIEGPGKARIKLPPPAPAATP